MKRDTLREREPRFVDIVVLDGLGSKPDAMCDFTLCTVSNRSAVMGGTMPMAALFGGAFAHPAFKVEFAGEETL